MSWPNPRFRTLEDAMKFIETRDPDLCVPIYVTEDTPVGRKIRVNPQYSDAPFEERVIFDKIGAMTRRK